MEVRPYNGNEFGNQVAKLVKAPTQRGVCRNRSGERPMRLATDWCREWQPVVRVRQ